MFQSHIDVRLLRKGLILLLTVVDEKLIEIEGLMIHCAADSGYLDEIEGFILLWKYVYDCYVETKGYIIVLISVYCCQASIEG